MDITNLQSLLFNQVQATVPAFGTRGGTTGSQTQQRAGSFASKLNNAVERSAGGNGAVKNEAAHPAADMEKPMVSNSDNGTANEPHPKQTAKESRTTDIPGAAGGEQPSADTISENPDKFLGAAALTAPMPQGANIIGENAGIQFDGSQDNFFQKFLERPLLALTAEDVKGLPPEAVKILETMLANFNNLAKGQVISQAVAEEILAAAKQEWDALAAKGGLPKIAGSEQEGFYRQLLDAAKEPQDKHRLTNPVEVLAKLEAGVAKQEAGLIKPEGEPQKPVVEFVRLTVIDNAKPAEGIVKPDPERQSVPEAVVPTTKESTEQNLANRQNTGSQQFFGQMAESNQEQIKNSAQPVNSSQPFAVFSETVSQSHSEKTGASQLQQPSDFTTPRDEFQIKEQIVRQATLINRSAQESEMIIRLKPEHLGEMALKVTVTNGVVNAAFHSNNAEVRGILENSLHQLKNDLANAGFKVDNVSISAGLSQFAADQERAMQWQQQQSRRFSGKAGEEGYADAVESVTTIQQGINTSKDDGVDYRI